MAVAGTVGTGEQGLLLVVKLTVLEVRVCPVLVRTALFRTAQGPPGFEKLPLIMMVTESQNPPPGKPLA